MVLVHRNISIVVSLKIKENDIINIIKHKITTPTFRLSFTRRHIPSPGSYFESYLLLSTNDVKVLKEIIFLIFI